MSQKRVLYGLRPAVLDKKNWNARPVVGLLATRFCVLRSPKSFRLFLGHQPQKVKYSI